MLLRNIIYRTDLSFFASWEKPYYPIYFFDSADLPDKFLRPSNKAASDGTQVFDLVVGDKVAEAAVIKYAAQHGELNDLIKLIFGAADAWFEEDEEIFVHPKDPYKVRALIAYICSLVTSITYY